MFIESPCYFIQVVNRIISQIELAFKAEQMLTPDTKQFDFYEDMDRAGRFKGPLK